MFLIRHLRRKQFTSMSATSLPSELDFEVCSIYIRPDLRLSLLQLRNMHLTPYNLTTVSVIKVLVGSFP